MLINFFFFWKNDVSRTQRWQPFVAVIWTHKVIARWKGQKGVSLFLLNMYLKRAQMKAFQELFFKFFSFFLTYSLAPSICHKMDEFWGGALNGPQKHKGYSKAFSPLIPPSGTLCSTPWGSHISELWLGETHFFDQMLCAERTGAHSLCQFFLSRIW